MANITRAIKYDIEYVSDSHPPPITFTTGDKIKWIVKHPVSGERLRKPEYRDLLLDSIESDIYPILCHHITKYINVSKNIKILGINFNKKNIEVQHISFEHDGKFLTITEQIPTLNKVKINKKELSLEQSENFIIETYGT